MLRPNLPPGRQFLATLLASLPGLAVLAALGFGGYLGWGAAFLAAAALFAISWPLVRLYLGDVTAFAAFIARLSGGEPAADPPAFRLSVTADELSRAAAGLHESWKQQRRALEDASSASKRILDGLPDPVLAVDRARRVTHINASAEAIFGGQSRGADLAAVLRHPAVLAAVDAALAGGSPQAVEFARADRAAIAMIVHVVGLERQAGDGTAALLAFHDVTALRRTERMRADFVANASHELKTPISMLIGFIETLRGPARDDAAARERFLAIMEEQAQRMSRLVSDLLSLSDIELREHSRPADAIDAVAVLRSVLDMFELRARQRRVTLKLELECSDAPVLGDRDELGQVFQNLIDNAIKYSRPDTAVRCRVERAPGPGGEGEGLRIAVIDQGEGIAAEHLPRLTERFYRVDDARSRKLGGTGLGLAIVKHIVNRHRGRLDIASTVGEGTSIAVTLPLAPADARPGPVTEPAKTGRRRA